MSRKPENQFIDSVHRHLPPPSELHREGMANPYRSGTADMWYSGKSDLWVEYKFIVVPKRGDTMIDLVGGKNPPLSKLQQDWLARRHDEGRNVWVIVGCAAGGVIFRGKQWAQPLPSLEFQRSLVDRKSIAREIASTLAQR